ncbi:MAG TPA: zf-HC2 domain-containing protein, partial [Blastocatellia bacterium]|nr:zf-HC2 domain-containing protein [Blastocatellia bacterium]
MKCKKYEMTASAYLDRQLAEEEEIEYRSHLGMCADCRSYLSELREVSLLVSGVSHPETPGELHSYIMSAVERTGASQAASPARVYEWLLKMNPLPISYLTGAFVSVCLFTFVLSGFRPIPVIGPDGKQMIAIPVTTGPIVTGSEPEFNSYNNLPPNTASTGNEH